MSQATDYYKILRIGYDARKEDIISSYRRLCKIYHPDINRDPGAIEIMKQINLAYSILFNDMSREEYNRTYRRGAVRGEGPVRDERTVQDEKKAHSIMGDYFKSLMAGDFERAYHALSLYDRQYVTMQSFCKWRKAVQRVYTMRGYKINDIGENTSLTLENGKTVPAKKLYIDVTEKNNSGQKLESSKITKFAVSENGFWRVFIGYRDLNEIAKTFENLSIQQEQGEIAKMWEEYCEDMYRDMNILSLRGFLKRADKELYRFKRYSQPMALACIKVKPSGGRMSEQALANINEAAAEIITKSVRDTDIAAYTGNGIFAILYVELKKRHASSVLRRLVSNVERGISSPAAPKINVSSSFLIYTGGELKNYIEKNSANL